ncbi:MAG: tetratricopeptide repeat protein, partial [Planctomycetota bacterium]
MTLIVAAQLKNSIIIGSDVLISCGPMQDKQYYALKKLTILGNSNKIYGVACNVNPSSLVIFERRFTQLEKEKPNLFKGPLNEQSFLGKELLQIMEQTRQQLGRDEIIDILFASVYDSVPSVLSYRITKRKRLMPPPFANEKTNLVHGLFRIGLSDNNRHQVVEKFFKNLNIDIPNSTPEQIALFTYQAIAKGIEENSSMVNYPIIRYKIDVNGITSIEDDGLSKKEWRRQLFAYEKILKIDPVFKEALVNKGVTLEKLGQYEEALSAYEDTLKIDQKCRDAWYNKGIILDKLNKRYEALSAYDEALKIDPKYESALINKSIVLCKLNKYQEALFLLEETLK